MRLAPQRRAIFRQFFDIRTSKSGPSPSCFWHFDLQMCFAHSGVPIFHTQTSKKSSALRCFVHFDLQMCFSLQPRAIFGHVDFQKCSGTVSFLTFWLANVLLATAACNFSLSALSSYLRTRRFSEPTFRPSRHTNHWKITAIRHFPNISRGWIFFLLTFAQLYLLSSDSTSLLCFSSSDSAILCFSALLFQLSILSEVRLLNFLWQDKFGEFGDAILSFIMMCFLQNIEHWKILTDFFPHPWVMSIQKKGQVKLMLGTPLKTNCWSQKKGPIGKGKTFTKTSKWAVTKTLVICCILVIILPSYIGNITNHYKDPH